MNGNLPVLTAGVCAVLLFALVLSLIFSKQFRDAMLGGTGEASVLGVLTVKGVAIVLLCALFVGGLIYSVQLECRHRQISAIDQHPADCSNEKKQVEALNKQIAAFEKKTQALEAELDKETAGREQAEKTVTEVVKANEMCQAELQDKVAELNKYKEDERTPFAKLVKINSDIQSYHPAIDFAWDEENKQEEAYRILELLGIFGYYSSAPTKDPAKAEQAVIAFQKDRGILPEKETHQGLLGRQTFLELIEAYMAYEKDATVSR